jgi:hypothetical protein
MISIRCKKCNRELTGTTSKPVSCGCPNMAMINGDKISAVDLTQLVMLSSHEKKEKTGSFSMEDELWMESRRNRKIRKLDFEIR